MSLVQKEQQGDVILGFPSRICVGRQGSKHEIFVSHDVGGSHDTEWLIENRAISEPRLFQGVASASAEVAVVNQLLNSGGTLAGVRFIEPRFLRLSFEEWIGPDASKS